MKAILAFLLLIASSLAVTTFSDIGLPFGARAAFAEEDDGDDEECPAGFEESEESCTPEEREDGCRDIRLDNGTGCVDRD